VSDTINSELFSDFLLREYDNVANAYFNIKNSISLFFRYYILIASVPLTVFLFFLGKTSNEQNFLFTDLSAVFSSICFLTTFVGFSLMMYVLSMNFTATLYARQVNGIRYFYYKNSNLSISSKELIKVLPDDIKLPKYSLWGSIKYLLFAFSAINAFYFALGLRFLLDFNNKYFASYWFLALCLQVAISFITTWIKAAND
jgi:hypothetical protein